MPKTTTVLSAAMRLDGQFACRTFEGGMTKDRFLGYLREDLWPCLKEGDIVVMDNLRAHHTKGVEELLRSVGTVPLYLPPYSPDFNPIGKIYHRDAAFAADSPKKPQLSQKSSSDQSVDKPSGSYMGRTSRNARTGWTQNTPNRP